MRFVVGVFRLIWVGLLVCFVLFAVQVLFRFISSSTKGRMIRRVAAWLPMAFGIRVRVKGRVPDEGSRCTGISSRGKGYLICANHISFADIFVLDSVLPSRFVAKAEIARWPLFGAITTGVDTIYIDRGNRRAIVLVAEAMSAALEAGRNVLFFPEGTTGPGDRLLPFHPNLFSSACSCGAEVLPVSLRYTLRGETTTLTSYAHESLFRVLRRIVFTPGLGVDVSIGEPVATEGRDRREVCADAARFVAQSMGMPDATAERAEEIRRMRAEHQREA